MHCVACFELSFSFGLVLSSGCSFACLIFSIGFRAFVFDWFQSFSFASSFSNFCLASRLWLRGSSASFDGNLISRVCFGFWHSFVIFQLVSFLWYSIEIFGAITQLVCSLVSLLEFEPSPLSPHAFCIAFVSISLCIDFGRTDISCVAFVSYITLYTLHQLSFFYISLAFPYAICDLVYGW